MRKFTIVLMMLIFSSFQLFAQNKTISGKVTDDRGAGIQNASVKPKGSAKGAITSADGSFTLSVGSDVKQLVISAVNYETQTVNISGSSVSVKMSASAASTIDEVVVQVPYGTQKKANITGSVGSVSAKQISNQVVTSVTNALEGLVTGISATNGGGQPGNSDAAIRIRGFGSISATNRPLYVVNGIPYDGDISSISTDDIETVDVLKDAAVSALYGARAANGVIMITTKKGKKGNLKVTVNLRQGYSRRAIPEYDKLNSPQFYEMSWEAIRNSRVYGQNESMSEAGLFASNYLIYAPNGTSNLGYNKYNVPDDKLVDPATGKFNNSAKALWNDNYADALFRTATRTNVNFGLSGATDKSDFFFSMSYLDEKGIMQRSDFNRYTMRVGANMSPTSWINAGANLDVAYSTQNYTQGASSVNPFYISRTIGPIYPVYQKNWATGENILDKNGNPIYDYGDPQYAGQKTRPYQANSNALGSLMLDENSAKYLNTTFSGYFEIKFLKNFSFKNTIGGNFYDERDKSYLNRNYGSSVNIGGSTTISSSRNISTTVNQVLSWTKSYSKHNIRALVGHEAYSVNSVGLSASGRNNLFDNLNELQNDSAINGNPTSSTDFLNIEGFLSNVNYDYDGKYLISASFRRDGSSRFKNNRWGNFYSFGLGWRISQEKFLQSVRWINDLKVRASYGQQGNENIGSGLTQYIDKQFYIPNGNGGFQQQQIKANPDLKWEGNNVFNVGIDFTLFNRKLQGTIEYFNRRTTDMIFSVPLSSVLGGYNSIYKNAGSLSNKGIEISLGYNAITTKNFDWRVDLNLTSYKNELTEMPAELAAKGIQSGISRIAVGQPIYNFYYIREFKGVDPTSGLALYSKDVLDANGKATAKLLTDLPSQGSYYYQGNPIPKFNGGLTNSFRYRNVELSIITTFSYGGQFYDDNYAGIMSIGSSLGTAWHTDILNRWQKVGDVTNVPRLQLGGGAYETGSTRFLFDASWLNIKNISFTYNLPKSSTSKIGINDLSLRFSVDNAWIFTAKKGSNPQESFTGRASSAYPPFRTVNFGINCTF